MKARLKYISISPQKARLVADMIRGRQVEDARNVLQHCKRTVARDIHKLLMSAVANAVHNVPDGATPPDPDLLYVDRVWVDTAPSLKRWRARAMGRANRILKRHCHINLQLAQRDRKGGKQRQKG